MRCRIPIVYLVDSAGVNLPYQGGVFPGQYGASRIFYYNSHHAALLAHSAVRRGDGTSASPAARTCRRSPTCILMVKGTSFMGLGGPNLVKGATGQDDRRRNARRRGHPHRAVRAWRTTADKDDATCLAQLRELIERLPAPVRRPARGARPPAAAAGDPLRPPPRRSSHVVRHARRAAHASSTVASSTSSKRITRARSSAAMPRIEGIAVGVIANQRGLIKAPPGRDRPASAASSTPRAPRRSRTSSIAATARDSRCSSCRTSPDSWSAPRPSTPGSFAPARASSRRWRPPRCPKIVLTVNHASGAGYYAMAGQGFDPDFIFSLADRTHGRDGRRSRPCRRCTARRLDEAKKQGKKAERRSVGARSTRCAPTTSTSSMRATPPRAVSSTRSCIPRTRGTCSRSRCARRCRIRGPHLGAFVLPHASRTSMTHAAVDRIVRVASGQGFWGDWLEAPRRQVEGGPIDYLMLDYLAEVTMSHPAEAEGARSERWATRATSSAPSRASFGAVANRGVKVIANAGGVNPRGVRRRRSRGRARRPACAASSALASSPATTSCRASTSCSPAGTRSRTWTPASRWPPSATACCRRTRTSGRRRSSKRCARGANIVITGRSTDTALTMAPLRHEFGWAADDWDRLAAGIIAGHIIECGAQCSGGNCLRDWRSIPDLANVGYPIVEGARGRNASSSPSIPAPADGCRRARGHGAAACTRWAIRTRTSRPTSSPTSRRSGSSRAGEDRVRVFGIQGRPPTDVPQGVDRVPRRLQGRRDARVRLARCAREGATRGPRAARAPRPPRVSRSTQILHGVRRRDRRRTGRWPGRRARSRRRCSSASVSAARTDAWSSDSRAKSRRSS